MSKMYKLKKTKTWSDSFLFQPIPAEGHFCFVRYRQMAGKQIPGPIQAGPRRKVSMDARSFRQNRRANDVLARKTVLKPGLSEELWFHTTCC